MQAHRGDVYVHVALSKTYKGKPRSKPVWLMRYRLPSGKQSRQVLGPAWTRKGRPPHGHLTEQEAHAVAQAFAVKHGAHTPQVRRTFAAALAAFIAHCETEKGLRGSTMHEYRKIGARLAGRSWHGKQTWAARRLDTFEAAELVALRGELTDAGRGADTINHYRRVLRGIFGTEPSSPALAWPWMAKKAESAGKLRFYTPAQVRRLIEHAHSDLDRAIFTLATQAGPRLSEIRALRVGNVDFAVGVLRIEDGYTTHGGHAGNKGRRVRSVPMSSEVRSALAPLCEGRDPGELVFEEEGRPGRPICGVNLYRRFVKAAERAGLPRIRLHDLRHTFGTQAIRGFKIHEVQAMMGHRHLTTTEIYLHYAPDPEAAAKLSALWSEALPAGQAGEMTPPATPAATSDQPDRAALSQAERSNVIPLRRAA